MSAAARSKPPTPASPDGLVVIAFISAKELEQWLAKHHATSAGIWLRIFKKHSDHATVSYAEALDVALCYGWIDGQKRRCDDASFLQRFTPRTPRSGWSKVNTEHVARLSAEGRMRPAGLAAVDAARADGRWAAAYASSRVFEMPEAFTAALAASPTAARHYETLNKANRFAIYYRLTTAKRPETQARRLRELVEMLERGEKLH